MNKSVHFRSWHENDAIDIAQSSDFKQLAVVAQRIIARTSEPLHMVSGPISTGGVGSIPGNMSVLRGVIEILHREEGLAVFSQVPFEGRMVGLYEIWHKENLDKPYCMPILEDFYWPIFDSGRIAQLHFIHGWESSFGARWEHEACTQLRIGRRYLPKEMTAQALVVAHERH